MNDYGIGSFFEAVISLLKFLQIVFFVLIVGLVLIGGWLLVELFT